MAQTGRYHGGLVFSGNEGGALERFGRIVSATLEDYGHMVERQTLVDAHEARIVSSQYLVKLTYDSLLSGDTRTTRLDRVAGLNSKGQTATSQDQTRLAITLTPAAPGSDDRNMSELMLVVMIYRMIDLCSTVSIEWLDPDVSLTVDQFMSAFADVSPKRMRKRTKALANNGERFAPVDDNTVAGLSTRYDKISARTPHFGKIGLIELSDDEALALSFRTMPHPDEVDAEEVQPDNDIRRLTSWSMTGCLVFVAAPVAVSMAAVNLIKGEDFRLNTHVLALTSSIATLQSIGAIDSVAALFAV